MIFGFIPVLCLWYAAIVALDLKVVRFLAEGSGKHPRVLGTGPAAEALRRDLELKRGAPAAATGSRVMWMSRAGVFWDYGVGGRRVFFETEL